MSKVVTEKKIMILSQLLIITLVNVSQSI